LLDELMHSMACRSAIMAGDPITEEQASELMRRADLIDNPQSCAHGRPTSLRLTFRELIRHFKR
jgi:DNA mismatch repair protein MutL